MWGEEVFPVILYAAAFLSFSPLTLFDCERGREETGGQPKWKRGTFGQPSVSLFSFWSRGDGRWKEEEGDRPLLACQELSHNPLSDLRHAVHSLSIQCSPPPPLNASSHTPY